MAHMMLTTAALVAIAAAGAAGEAPPPTARETGEARVERHVAEDDHVRIEELRVRGQSQRIVVKPKGAGAREYEIVPSSGAIDRSQGDRRGFGERVWRLFSF
jgi:hypothetical protein